MSSTISLSTLCGRAHPVGFSTAVSVTGFPPDATLGIDVLDLDQKRIQLLSRGTVTTDATGALAAMPVQINVPEGLYFVRVFVDDGTGNPANGQPESQVTIAAPCDVLYAPTASSSNAAFHSVEIIDVTVRSAPILIRDVSVPVNPLLSLDVSPDRRRFYILGTLLGATSPSIGAYDVNTGLAISSLAVSASTQVVAMSPDGLILVLAAGSALTSVSTATMALRPQSFTEPLGHPIDALVFSPDGKTLAVTSQAVVHLLDPVALTVLKSVPIVSTSSGPASGMAAVFTNTNLLLLWESSLSEVYQVDLTTRAQIVSATIPVDSSTFQGGLGTSTFIPQIVYSPTTENAYVSAIIEMLTVSPQSAAVVDLTDFVGLADELLMTPDGGQIYIAKHPTDTAGPTTLDLFDTGAGSVTGASIFEFKFESMARVPMIMRSNPRA